MQIKATSPRISTCSVPVTTYSHKPTSAISIMIYERGRTKFRLIIYPNEKVETSQLQRGRQNRVIFSSTIQKDKIERKIKSGKNNKEMPFVFMDEHGFLCWPACNTCFLCSSNGKESACNVEDLGLIPGSGRSPGEGNGNPLQYSCLENPMDRGAWWATVHGVTELDMTQ